MIRCLYVLFDDECGMCRRCRDWLTHQAAFVPLHFIALQSPEAKRLLPEIFALNPEERLLVVGDDSAVYRGASAWIMCLWALQKYRNHAQHLAQPILLQFARIACEMLSRNRFFISRHFFHDDAQNVARRLAAHVAPRRVNGDCASVTG